MNPVEVMLLAADKVSPGTGALGVLGPILPILLVFGLYYVLLIRPQSKRQAQDEAMRSSLKKNDRVVTIGGIFGTVAKIDVNAGEITLKINESTRMQMRLNAIASRVDSGKDAGDETDSRDNTES